MVNIIGAISPGEALSVQEQYLRLLEELLQLKSKNRSSNLRIFEKERLIYGDSGEAADREFVNEISGLEGQILNPKALDRIYQLREAPVGQIVEDAPNLKVELRGKVILQSDDAGKVIVNELLARQREKTPNSDKNQPSISENPTESSKKSTHSNDNTSELLETVRRSLHSKDYSPIHEALLEQPKEVKKRVIKALTKEEIEQVKKLKQQFMAEGLAGVRPPASRSHPKERISSQMSQTGEQVTSALRSQNLAEVNAPLEAASSAPKRAESSKQGGERVLRSLQALPDSPSKQLAILYAQQIQNFAQTVQAQQHQIEQLRERIRELKKPWWARFASDIASTLVNWQQRYQAVTAIYKTYTQQIGHGDSIDRRTNYQIEKTGNTFTLRDNQNQVLMQFSRTPLGWRINDENLNPENYRDIERMRKQQENGEQIDGSFSPLGTLEADREMEFYLRVRTVARRLVDYAVKRGQKLVLDGDRFSYKWTATPDGQVQISAKDGRGLILAAAGEKTLVRANERDLGYFERAIAKLQSFEMAQAHSTQLKPSLKKAPAQLDR